MCRGGVLNSKLGMKLVIEFNPRQLPHLANWQHWSRGDYVTGLEPDANPPVGQATARKNGTLTMLEPGQSPNYELRIRIETGE